MCIFSCCNCCNNQMAGYNKSNCFGRFLSRKKQQRHFMEWWRHPICFSALHLQIFQCTVARTKEVVSGSLSGATQDSDSGDWTQLFPPQDQGLRGTRLLDFQITTHTRKMLLLDRVLEYLPFLPFCPNIQNMDM